MTNGELGVALDGRAHQSRVVTTWWENAPNGVVDGLGDEANFLIPTETGENLWGALLRM